MGQTCDFNANTFQTTKHQITEGTQDAAFEGGWDTDVQLMEGQHIKLAHSIGSLNANFSVRTLTSINEKSETQFKTQTAIAAVKEKLQETSKTRKLDSFFMNFQTIFDLVESKKTERPIEEEMSIEDEIATLRQQKSLEADNEKIKKPRKVSQDFKKIEINIQDFIRIEEKPITEFYTFGQKIGEGSFGNVYKATCKISKQERAIKVFKKRRMSKQSKKQFLAEIQLLVKLDHPNIIKVYEVYYYNYFYYMVTQYCQGGSIFGYLDKKTLYNEKIVSQIMRQLLSALSYIHKNCIAHLDLKLENLVFLESYEKNLGKVYIKLIDFGCSKVFTPFKKMKSRVQGTLSYMSPECLKGFYSQKSDIWSAGVILYILLSGQSPFKSKDNIQTMEKIKNKQINFKEKCWSKVSNDSKDLILSMLNRDQHKRLSAKKCLQHSWFSNIKRSNSNFNNKDLLHKMQDYYWANNFVAIIETFISLKKVNQAQRKRLSDIFHELDADGSGTIENNELIEIYKANCGQHDSEQIERIVNKIDSNHSGSISFNQFLIFMTGRKQIFEKNHLQEAFTYFDVNKTGFLDRNELKKILKGVQAQQFEFLLQELDQNGDQKISKEEFFDYFSQF